MHIALHFPLADVRRYVPDAQIPAWPLRPPRDFVRGFGRARDRAQHPWADRFPAEDTYCDAKRVVRFEPNLRKHKVGIDGTSVKLYCAHRRLLGDRLGAMRLEIGIGSYAESAPRNLSGESLLAILAQVLELRVTIHASTGTKTSDLSRADISIARAYLAATSPRKADVPRWWVTPGRPLCIVMYDRESEVASLPTGTRKIGDVVAPLLSADTSAAPMLTGPNGAPATAVTASPPTQNDMRFEISHLNVEHRGVSVRVLFLGVPRADRRMQYQQRRLRVHLARVHAERECLKEVLRLIDLERLTVEPNVPASDRLQQYLRAVFARISRPTFDGLPQESLARAMEDGYDAITEEQRDRIMGRLGKAVAYVVRDATVALGTTSAVVTNIFAERVDVSNGGIIGGSGNQVVNVAAGASVHGPIVNGVIRDSFNTIEKSNANDDLKKELTNLATVVAQMVEKLDKEQATEASRDLKALTEEATTPAPRRKWYELSSAGLLEAAKFSGEFAGQIAASLASVTKLLAF